jgi:hypothetical protein
LFYIKSYFCSDNIEPDKQQKPGRKFFKMPASPLISKKINTKVATKKTEPPVDQPISSSPLSRQKGLKQLISTSQTTKQLINRTNNKSEVVPPSSSVVYKATKDSTQNQDIALMVVEQSTDKVTGSEGQSGSDVATSLLKIQSKHKDYAKERQELLRDSGKPNKRDQKV